ncbi:MAG: GNAT family N-acetyltransferase [Candidatus Electrothrix sp. Rat3]|nr:GNAT family N-acetyltransferase [Candidatus Electrothrix rattekaaiensis]
MNLHTTFVELDKARHNRAVFACGEKELDLFLKTQAAKHMKVGISKTLVLADTREPIDGKHPICAFYTIAPGTVKRAFLPVELAKKLPDYPVPVFLIARLAVDKKYQGKGIGRITLINVLEYLWKVNSRMAAYAVIVDCLTDDLQAFYQQYGFVVLGEYNNKLRMFLPMKVIERLFKTKR